MYLERLALILEIVGQRGEATVADICSHADVPRPSVYRLVQDLTGAGLLEPAGQRRVAIGNRLRRITNGDLSDQALLDTIAPVLREGANDHDATFFLARVRGHAVEIVHVETPDNGVSFLHPGLGRRPLHACSCSKAVAAFSPEVATGIAGRLRAYTEFTLTDHDDLAAEFRRIRELGYAECVEELERGMCSVAVPLGPGPGAPSMSIGATGSLRVFGPEFRERMGRELVRISDDLVGRLGWDQPAVTEAIA